MKDKNKEPSIGILLREAEHAHHNKINRRLEQIGMQRTFGPLLMNLSHHEGIIQNDFAVISGVTAPTMSVNLQKMEDLNLIIKKPNENDQRQTCLYLTEYGRELSQKTKAEISIIEDELVQDFTEDEKNIVKSLLYRMIKNSKKI